MANFDFNKIEKKWRERWEDEEIYHTELVDESREKFYNLMMFPYPSGDKLHIGHVYNYTGADTFGRMKLMQGLNVFEPIGFDAFGLPAENYAIKNNVHPAISTKENIDFMRRQLKNLGCMYDWTKEVNTSDPNYYKWTQWLFLVLYKAGLAKRKKAPVNWCPSCKTVLANEQVINGACERCESQVVQKNIKQWFFEITKYAEKLLSGLNKIDWPKRTILMQKNWIGKSDGAEIDFEIDSSSYRVKTFTTRPDTLFGVTFMVFSPEHKLIEALKEKITNYQEVKNYVEKSKEKSEFERGALIKQKTGVLLKGTNAINPANKTKIPIYVADFVLPSYGTGAIMGVPAHDERDFEFAKQFNIPIKPVVESTLKESIMIQLHDDDSSDAAYKIRRLSRAKEHVTPTVQIFEVSKEKIREIINILKESSIGNNKDYDLIAKGNDFTLESPQNSIDFLKAYTGDGKHINSEFINGLNNYEAIRKIIKWLEDKKIGRKKFYYHLHDWLISRQRYWGAPIPIIFCDKCGEVPVSEKELPVELPKLDDFKPANDGQSPLARLTKFVNVRCPKCDSKAKRSTETMDTFVCSSWYFLRYLSPDLDTATFDKNLVKKWLPVDQYCGGAEHAVMHLLYVRFITKVLKDQGYLDFDEPFSKLNHQGIILAEDGSKMSKSKGNVIIPDNYFKKYGVDTFRMYVLFLAPFEQGGAWNDKGILGTKRFLDKIWTYKNSISDIKPENESLKIAHQTIQKVGDDFQNFHFNTAIAALMEYLNYLIKAKEKSKETFIILIKLLAPICPYFCEEIWQILGNKKSIFLSDWPKYNAGFAQSAEIILPVQINGKLRATIKISSEISEEEVTEKALKSEKIKKYLGNKKIKKTIYVPGHILNFVI
jgi:leucyl-tRNA synthetase